MVREERGLRSRSQAALFIALARRSRGRTGVLGRDAGRRARACHRARPISVARGVAERAIGRGFDRQVSHPERQFFYLPFMHSENLADHERCLELARRYGDDEFSKYAEQHADIIRRFGRFPHRNAVLGRAATLEEQAFLDNGGFAG
jgi:uncharacterized protein (DUF924 family)